MTKYAILGNEGDIHIRAARDTRHKQRQRKQETKIEEMQNETADETPGRQSATPEQDTTGQEAAPNERLAAQRKEATAPVASIMEHTKLSKQQQASEMT